MHQESQRDRCQACLEIELPSPKVAWPSTTLVRELKLLERRPRAGGRTQVDHPTGAHDDHANALALAAALAIGGNKMPELHIITFPDEPC